MNRIQIQSPAIPPIPDLPIHLAHVLAHEVPAELAEVAQHLGLVPVLDLDLALPHQHDEARGEDARALVHILNPVHDRDLNPLGVGAVAGAGARTRLAQPADQVDETVAKASRALLLHADDVGALEAIPIARTVAHHLHLLGERLPNLSALLNEAGLKKALGHRLSVGIVHQ